MDLKIKSSLITDTLNLINVKSSTQKHFEKYQKKQSQNRLWNFNAAPKSPTIINNSNSNYGNDNDPLEDIRNIHCGQIAKKLELHEDSNIGNFSRIFPPDNEELLDSYLNLLLYLTSLMNTQNSGTIATKIRKEYLLSKKSMEEIKQVKYQEWKEQRLKSSSNSVDGSQRSFKISSILRNSPPIKPRISAPKLKKTGIDMNVQNITYPGCIGRIA